MLKEIDYQTNQTPEQVKAFVIKQLKAQIAYMETDAYTGREPFLFFGTQDNDPVAIAGGKSHEMALLLNGAASVNIQLKSVLLAAGGALLVDNAEDVVKDFVELVNEQFSEEEKRIRLEIYWEI